MGIDWDYQYWESMEPYNEIAEETDLPKALGMYNALPLEERLIVCYWADMPGSPQHYEILKADESQLREWITKADEWMKNVRLSRPIN